MLQASMPKHDLQCPYSPKASSHGMKPLAGYPISGAVWSHQGFQAIQPNADRERSYDRIASPRGKVEVPVSWAPPASSKTPLAVRRRGTRGKNEGYAFRHLTIRCIS